MTEESKTGREHRDAEVAEIIKDLFTHYIDKGYRGDSIIAACACTLAIGSQIDKEPGDDDVVISHLTYHQNGYAVVTVDTDISIVLDLIKANGLEEEAGVNDMFMIKKENLSFEKDLDEIDEELSDTPKTPIVH